MVYGAIQMYYVVEVFSLDESRVKSFVDDWQKHVKYSLPKEIKGEVRVESRVGIYMYLLVVRKSLLGLLIVLKLADLSRKHGVSINTYEAGTVVIDGGYIDKMIRERLDKILPHLIYTIRESLLKRKLPRGKLREEVIKAMKT